VTVAGEPVRLLFVCLGNICRSPTAEGVMRSLVIAEGMAAQVELDSAGTGGWHVGAPPDRRAAAAASARGVTLAGEARRIEPEDLERFDLILAMDSANLRDLQALAGGTEAGAKIRLLREFDPDGAGERDLDVPDPYYGGEDGFGRVFELVRAACLGLLEEIRAGRVP
jgi:low molecular weight protein-tyrosine phosphatase